MDFFVFSVYFVITNLFIITLYFKFYYFAGIAFTFT